MLRFERKLAAALARNETLVDARQTSVAFELRFERGVVRVHPDEDRIGCRFLDSEVIAACAIDERECLLARPTASNFEVERKRLAVDIEFASPDALLRQAFLNGAIGVRGSRREQRDQPHGSKYCPHKRSFHDDYRLPELNEASARANRRTGVQRTLGVERSPCQSSDRMMLVTYQTAMSSCELDSLHANDKSSDRAVTTRRLE